MNAFDDMNKAMDQARDTMRAADRAAADMARMLVGRLRHCGGYSLRQLKKELRDFNLTTGEWRDSK